MADVYTHIESAQFPTSSTLDLSPRVEVRPTLDLDSLNPIARHPDVYPFVSNDSSPPAEEFALDPDHLYLGIYTPSLVGFWQARQIGNGEVFNMHTCILPEGRGQVATLAAPQCSLHLFSRTPAMTLTTQVPATNLAARKFALWCGFKPIYVDKGGWVKGGEPHDLETLYLSLLDWFFHPLTGDPHLRARSLLSSLAVHGQFAKAAYLHSLLTSLVGDFTGDSRCQ